MVDLDSMRPPLRAPSVLPQPKPPQSWPYVSFPILTVSRAHLTLPSGPSLVQRRPQSSVVCSRRRGLSPRSRSRGRTRRQQGPRSCHLHYPRSHGAARTSPHIHLGEPCIRVPHCRLQLHRCPFFPIPGRPRNVLFHRFIRQSHAQRLE